MLELYEPAQMRIASLRVLSFVQRKTGNFQNIDAGKTGIWFRREDAPYRQCDGLAQAFMPRLEIDSGQHNRRC